jgi:hypothetical protein
MKFSFKMYAEMFGRERVKKPKKDSLPALALNQNGSGNMRKRSNTRRMSISEEKMGLLTILRKVRTNNEETSSPESPLFREHSPPPFKL